MPKTSQGDIFETAERVQLAIVFGHIGFNQMSVLWRSFARRHVGLRIRGNPFNRFSDRPVEWSEGRWLWFVPEEKNHGMTESQLKNVLDLVLTWASENQISSVATNGIADTNHGHDTASNRRSDENRAQWLKNYADQAEQKYGVSIELISLNDIFVRVANNMQ